MLKEGRPGLTDTQKAEMWQRWKAGQSTDEICDALRRSWASVLEQLSLSGGLQPRVRRRPARALTFAEREEVSRGLCAGRSLRCIARGLGRAPSTVSREVARHWGR